MYISSERLKNRIDEIAKEAYARSNHVVSFEEYIAVPYFGHIILRFMLNRDGYTLDDLDRYENMLYEIVGDEFLIDFMGCVYKKAGVDYSDLGKRLICMKSKYQNETVVPSVHSDGIKSDAKALLKAAGLNADEKVWEIQTEEDGFILLIMGNESKKIAETDKLYVGEVAEEACIGLIKAAVFGKRNKVSLARLLLEPYENE